MSKLFNEESKHTLGMDVPSLGKIYRVTTIGWDNSAKCGQTFCVAKSLKVIIVGSIVQSSNY